MEKNGDKSCFEGKPDALGERIQKWNYKAKKRYEDYHDECVDEQEKTGYCYSTSIFTWWYHNRRKKELKKSWRWVQSKLLARRIWLSQKHFRNFRQDRIPLVFSFTVPFWKSKQNRAWKNIRDKFCNWSSKGRNTNSNSRCEYIGWAILENKPIGSVSFGRFAGQ